MDDHGYPTLYLKINFHDKKCSQSRHIREIRENFWSQKFCNIQYNTRDTVRTNLLQLWWKHVDFQNGELKISVMNDRQG